MGVRSRRGRSAALAPYWQAALRTPARAMITGLVLVGLVLGVGALLGGNGDDSEPAGPLATGSGPTHRPGAPREAQPGETGPGPTRPRLPSPTATTPPLVTPEKPAAAAPAATASSPSATAAGWARAWLDHRGPQQWIDGLQPYTTQEYLGLLGTVDIAQLPGGTVTGGPAIVEQAAGAATVTVPTSAVRLQLSLIQTDDGWRVANADRASQGR